jgi:hypothetical protein
MRRIQLQFAELHTPLFLAGKNFGYKLSTKLAGLQLAYDRDEKELLVTYNDKTAIVPWSNVSAMVESE